MTTIDIANPYAALNATATAPQTANQAGSADRFLKLLVAQMQNQDPLNPMDNAEVTSQMAQINTVSGLEQVNVSVNALGSQLLQLQALQGAGMVGRKVTLESDLLSIENGAGHGKFVLAGPADQAKVEILSPGGAVLHTITLTSLDKGEHDFTKALGNVADDAGLSFRVTATLGGKPVASQTLLEDKVLSVSTVGDTLALNLKTAGAVAFSSVLALN
jgi:flagellar basal-body rod modification protein FlgD